MSRELSLFRDFWNDVPSMLDTDWNNLPGYLSNDISGNMRKMLNAKCDFQDREDSYRIELELPGVKKKEVEIELKNDVLTVSWERKQEKKKGLGKNSRFERSQGSFTRSFTVGGADESKISAELRDGVLNITVPKTEEARPHRISIS